MYSKYIDLLLRWLDNSGVAVSTLAFHLPAGVLGRYYGTPNHQQFRIDVNVPNAKQALMTLAHEAGHWLGNETFGYKRHEYQRERQAKVYGWRVLMLIGAQHLFTRAEWMNFHK